MAHNSETERKWRSDAQSRERERELVRHKSGKTEDRKKDNNNKQTKKAVQLCKLTVLKFDKFSAYKLPLRKLSCHCMFIVIFSA